MSSTRLALMAALLTTAGCVLIVNEEMRVIGPAADLVAEGRREFVRACASCHGVDGRGAGPAASALRVPPPDLTMLAVRSGGRYPREHVIGVLAGDVELTAHGSRDMPVWSPVFAPPASGASDVASVYTRWWLNAIAAYVESIQTDLTARKPAAIPGREHIGTAWRRAPLAPVALLPAG
jgi:mono/diheme cytochrome c family protein